MITRRSWRPIPAVIGPVTTPRGEMLDRNGQVLVGNKQRLNITYFPPQGISDEKEWELARRFSTDYEVDETQLGTRDLKDLYLSLHKRKSTPNGSPKKKWRRIIKVI